jgi:hypothetical protein
MNGPQKEKIGAISEEIRRGEGGRRGPFGQWATYGSGLEEYLDHNTTASFFKLETMESLHDRMEAVAKETGKKIAVWEIFGQGVMGLQLGADLSVSWTFTDDRMKDPVRQKVFNGDIFDEARCASVFKEWSETYAKEYAVPVVVSRPLGAMQKYGTSTAALEHWCETIFEDLYGMVAGKGVLLLELSEAPTEQFEQFVTYLKSRGVKLRTREGYQVLAVDKE